MNPNQFGALFLVAFGTVVGAIFGAALIGAAVTMGLLIAMSIALLER